MQDLSGLIAFDADDRAVWPAGELQASLSHQLRTRLSTGLNQLHPDPEILSAILNSDPSIQTFGQLLHHPQPPMELLRLTKDFAKLAKRDHLANLPPEICLLLYYGSIVAGMLRHNERITRLTDDELRAGLNWVVRQPWVDDQTRRLFLEGLRHLRSGRSRWRK